MSTTPVTPKDSIQSHSIVEEMRSAYMDYAMSVIVGRALPDARDGLKPVHRRVLYGMYEMGNVHNKPHKKSARVVGDVMGKYHPHGDSAIYDTMVRMAQDFSLRAPLVDGQGNFGSVDGDSAAAMRYTEVRLTKLAEEFLHDIEKDTVVFGRNYDDTLNEPTLLPTKIPNLLLNGASGIAVGMATNIPPHNLNELCDGIELLLTQPDATNKDLYKKIKGPDFPTAGEIYGKKGITSAYETGRGKFKVRAKALIEPTGKGDRQQIIVTELPFQVNKAKLIESIANLVRDKKLDGISDLRDESDRDGNRIVIELKRDATPVVVLNKLFTMTQMQTSFGVIMLALVNNRPKVIGLREALNLFIEHRREIITRRTLFDLNKAKARAHILEGLTIALDNLDAVIKLIRGSKDVHVAREGLMKKFKLSQIQANAILEMRLQRLTNMERDKIINEYKEVMALIDHLTHILETPKMVDDIIVEETAEVKKNFGDPRRTVIKGALEEYSEEDLIEEEEMVVTVTHAGYIKRNPLSLYRSQKRGGRGKVGTGIKQEDFVTDVFVASTHAYLLIFTDAGKLYWQRVHELPQVGRAARGKPIINLIQMTQKETIAAIMTVDEFELGKYIMMATEKGVVKKTDLMAFSNPRSKGIIALDIREGDRLIDVRLTDGKSDIFLATEKGFGIRFKEDQVRSMGRNAGGVTGIKFKSGEDKVVGMVVLEENATILTASTNGYGKRTDASEYRQQSRGGKGVTNLKVTSKNGPVVGITQVQEDDDVMLISSQGKLIRMNVKDISKIGRSTQGVRLIHLGKDETMVAVTKIVNEENGEEAVTGNA
jgi:DNA gyrase subunit A